MNRTKYIICATLSLLLTCASTAFAGPAIEEKALKQLLAKGDDAQDIAKHYAFFDSDIVHRLVDFTLQELTTDAQTEFMLSLIWSAATAIERSEMLDTVSLPLKKRIVDTLNAKQNPEYTLIAKVLEHRFGIVSIDDIKLMPGDLARGSQVFQDLSMATFLSEGMRSRKGHNEAAKDFWTFQSALRTHMSDWRPTGFNGPLVKLISPMSGIEFRTYNGYRPSFSDGSGMSYEELTASLGPENVALRQTFIGRLPMESPELDLARTMGEVRFDYLVRKLRNKKIVVPTVSVVSTGIAAPIMKWRVQNTTKAGRCSASSHDFRTDGVDSHQFGENCKYNGGDSTTTQIHGSIAVGTQHSGYRDGSAQYWAAAGSFALGGFADRGDEDQTAHLSYSATGEVTLGQCTDLRQCAPIVAVDVNDGGRWFSNYSQNEPPGTQARIFVDGQLASTGDRRLIDRSDRAVTLKIELTRGYKHNGACCDAGGGQSKGGLFLAEAGDADVGLGGGFIPWPRRATQPIIVNPSAPNQPNNNNTFGAGGFGLYNYSPDLNRGQSQILADSLRAAMGFSYQPNIADPAIMAREYRKAVHLGSHADGGFYDEISTLLGALYLLHDFQTNRPADVDPRNVKLIGLLQAGLSDRIREDYHSRLEDQLVSQRRQLAQISSNLFSQVLSETRILLTEDTINQQATVQRLSDLAKFLDDPVFADSEFDALQDEIMRFQSAPLNNQLALIIRLDQLSQEMARIRADLLRKIDGLVVVLAQL